MPKGLERRELVGLQGKRFSRSVNLRGEIDFKIDKTLSLGKLFYIAKVCCGSLNRSCRMIPRREKVYLVSRSTQFASVPVPRLFLLRLLLLDSFCFLLLLLQHFLDF